MPLQHKPVHTVRSLIEAVSAYFEQHALFYGHGTDNPWDEACYLVLSVLGHAPDAPASVGVHQVSEHEAASIWAYAKTRVKRRVPLAYIIGEAWFCGRPFYVNEDVLVPRSPIAELIHTQFQPWVRPEAVTTALDLCTGSGCIALSIAAEMPWVSVTGSDISDAALAVARRNDARHAEVGPVNWVLSDGFESLKGQVFDLIVTNPPYVDRAEMDALPLEYRHEPPLGLASGHDGLDFTRQMLSEASNFLSAQGVLVCEVGASWPALVAAYPDRVVLGAGYTGVQTMLMKVPDVSANPPVLIFSPANRVTDNSKKDTLINISKVKEVVINLVDYRNY